MKFIFYSSFVLLIIYDIVQSSNFKNEYFFVYYTNQEINLITIIKVSSAFLKGCSLQVISFQ